MITEFSKLVGVPVLTILESGTTRGGRGELSDIRQLYWYLLHENGFSYSSIGRLSGRNHATVLAGIKRIRQLIDCGDKEVTRLYELTKHIKR